MIENSSSNEHPTRADDDVDNPSSKEALHASESDRTKHSDSTSWDTSNQGEESPNQETGHQTVRLVSRSLPMEFGDYRLLRKIGEGGMGVVYEAEQTSLGNRKLAVKMIKFIGSPHDDAVKRFENEVQAVARLEHRHIVPVYHLGIESGLHYFAMKFIEGEDLRELISTLKTAVSRGRPDSVRAAETQESQEAAEDSTHRSGWSKRDTLASQDVIDKISVSGSTAHPQFVKSFARMGIQAATALHYVHDHGIVHRDVKPANLILDVDGDVWLTDFGLARIRDNPALTAPGDLVGTYQYMSPEQAMGSKRVVVDHRSDIYSLGVTLYELLTLRRAFPGRTREDILRAIQFEHPQPVRKIAPGVPRDLETIVSKAMAKDPSARFQSGAEMAAELQRFQEGKPLTIRPPATVERLSYWARSNRQLVSSLAAISAVVFLASVIVAIVALGSRATMQGMLQQETKQKNKVTRLLEQSEGLRLAANSTLEADDDPTLALLLGVEAAKRHLGSDANEAIVHALDKGHQARILSGHTRPVGHVSFSNDGAKLVSSGKPDPESVATTRSAAEESDPPESNSAFEPAIVWETETGKNLGTLNSDAFVTSAVFGPHDSSILTAASHSPDNAEAQSDDRASTPPPVIWAATDYRKLVTFHDAFLYKAHPKAFSPNGRRVVLPIKGNAAAIYLVSGTKLVDLQGHSAPVFFAAFNHDGALVATAAADGTVGVWSSEDGEMVLSLAHWPHSEPESHEKRDLKWIEFSPDGRRLATGSISRGIELWDLENDGSPTQVESVAGTMGQFFGNGDLLATHGSPSFKIQIRAARDARWMDEIFPSDMLIHKAVISGDNRVVGILDMRDLRIFHLWDLERRELRTSFGDKLRVNRVYDLAISPDSKYAATACEDTKVRLWHVENGAERATYDVNDFGGRSQVTSSPDGSKLSIRTTEPAGMCVLFGFENGILANSVDGSARFPVGHRGPRFLVLHGNRLAIHSTENGRFLEMETYFEEPAHHLKRPFLAAINEQGDRVAIHEGETSVVLWKPDEDLRLLLPVGPAGLRSLSFSPDGSQLFAFGASGSIRIWDAESGTLLRTKENRDLVDHNALRFSPDGKQFALASRNGSASVFDSGSLELVRRIDVGQRVRPVQFSGDGEKLIIRSSSDTNETSVEIWDIETGNLESKIQVAGRVGLAPHPSSLEAILWSDTEGAFVWRPEENERLPLTSDPIGAGAYSSDGSSFYLSTASLGSRLNTDDFPPAVQSVPPSVTWWTREGLQEESTISLPLAIVADLHVTPKGRVFAAAQLRHRLTNYDTVSREKISVIAGHFGEVSSCNYFSDSQRLMTTSWDAHVSIWNVIDGRLIRSFSVDRTPLTAAALSVDEKTLLSGASSGECRIWNLDRDKQLPPDTFVALEMGLPVRHVAIDSSSENCLAIATDSSIELFRSETGDPVPLQIPATAVRWAEFSPDANSLLAIPETVETNQSGNEVLIIPLDGTSITRHSYEDKVQSSHFHPDSRRIVTVFGDPSTGFTVQIQDAKTGEVQHAFQHEIALHACFDSEGEFLYVAEFNSATIWRMADARRWMTIKNVAIPYSNSRGNALAPFTAGQNRRVLTRRFDDFRFRDTPLHPLDAAKDALPRELSDAESYRFLLKH